MPKFKVGDKVKRTKETFLFLFADSLIIDQVDKCGRLHFSNIPSVGGWNPDNFELVSEPLKLEVGKFYKTRDGRKVRIDAILPEDNPKQKKIIGWYEQSHTSGFCTTVHPTECCWWSDGRFRNSPVSNDLDIVGVWTDPPPKPRTGTGWMILDEGDKVSFFQTKPDKRFCPIYIRWEEIIDGDDNSK